MNYQMYDKPVDVRVDFEELDIDEVYFSDDDSSWNVHLDDEFESIDDSEDNTQLTAFISLMNEQPNTDSNFEFDLASCEEMYIA
jgi:hypothetical protein